MKRLFFSQGMLDSMVEAGKIRPVVFKTFALEQAADAHRLMESRGHIGKIVLKV